MSATNEAEARAESWLRAQGYTPSRPTWLPPGQNPDFWVESTTLAPPHLWAEVKSVDPDDSTAAMLKFSGLIAAAAIPPGLCGHAIMQFDPHAIEQSLQWVLKNFAARSKAYTGQKISLMFLQQTRDCDQEYRVEIDGETPMVVWARAGKLPLNPAAGITNEILTAPTRLQAPDGSESIGPAYQFFEPLHPIQCALVVRLDPHDTVLKRISYMCTGSGRMCERTARAMEKANTQIKTACETRDAPSLVILTPTGPFGDDDQMMQAAIYGQYTVPLHLKDNMTEHGDVYHGLDGVFRHNKNTHVSAAVHVRREGPATFFPNPYALHPIPEGATLFANSVRANVKFV